MNLPDLSSGQLFLWLPVFADNVPERDELFIYRDKWQPILEIFQYFNCAKKH
jgi:hypothetical protein